jgi:hypothetical protein
MDNRNGAAQDERPNGVQRITISYNPHTHKAEFDLGGLALDECLLLLERARLELDARYRFGRARELAAEAIQAQTIAQMVARHPGARIVES